MRLRHVLVAKLFVLLVNLHREFARRRQDQGTCAIAMRRQLIARQVLEHRQSECSRLAGAGLGDTEQIASGEQVRNSVFLDRGRLKEMRPVEGAKKRLGEAEGGKGVQ